MMNLFLFYALALNVSFADKIIDGFNAVISFIGKIFQGLFNLISDAFNAVLDFLEKPLSLLFYFLDGIFYFFAQLFNVVVKAVQIFVALFQFLGAIIMGVLRTIKMWLFPSVSGNTNFPSATEAGFSTVIDLLMPTGMMTVVPMVAIGFIWFYFIIKIIGLFGGQIMVNPLGRGGK